MQVNSLEDLQKRVDGSKDLAVQLNLRLRQDIDSMNKYKQTCDDDLQGKLDLARRKNEAIAKKLITVYGKFEEYLS